MKYPNITVQLSGEDGNIFAIIVRVSQALRRGGVSDEERQQFANEVKSSKDYDEALSVVCSWVNVE